MVYRPNQRGGGGGGQMPLSLTIENISFKPDGQILQVSAVAMRGTRTMQGLAVKFEVDGTPVGERTIDGTGKASLLLTEVTYASGVHSVIVRAVGENAVTQGSFTVPKPGEVQPDSPVIEVTGSSVQVKGGYQLSLSITAKKGSQPIGNVPVDIACAFLDEPETRYLDPTGKASAVIFVPNPTKLKMLVEVRCFIEEPPVEAQKVFDLEWKTRMPKRATVSKPWEVEAGKYKVQVAVEDDEGVIQDATVSATGGKEPVTKQTDEKGMAILDLTCLEDEEKTDFVIDIIPGIEKVAKFSLKGKKAEADKIKLVKPLPENAGFWAYFSRAWSKRRKTIKVEGEENE